MKKTILTIAVLYAAGALITPYFIANETQKQIRHFFNNSQQLKTLAQQSIHIELSNYSKGYFESTANMHLNWQSPDGETIYDGDFTAAIKHAPLSLSGLNAFEINATGSSQPSGEVGQYLSPNFAQIHAEKSIISLIAGNQSANALITLLPEKVNADGRDVDFKGLKANLVIPASAKDYGSVDVAFKGLSASEADGAKQLTIEPSEIKLSTTDNLSPDLEIDQLIWSFKEKEHNAHFELKDFHNQIGLIEAVQGRQDSIRPASFAISFDQFDFAINQNRKSGSIKIDDGALFFGFKPKGERFDYQLSVSASPHFSGDIKAALPITPKQVDINLNIASFGRDTVVAAIDHTFNDINQMAYPSSAKIREAIGNALGSAINASIAAQDLTADIDASIDGESGDLLKINGDIKEYLTSQGQLMDIMFSPQKGVPKYFHGSDLDIFASGAFLSATGLGQKILNSGIPAKGIINEHGDLKLDISITDDQVLINGQAAPM